MRTLSSSGNAARSARFSLLPYGLLALATLLSMVAPHLNWNREIVTLVLVAVAAVLLVSTLRLPLAWWHAHPVAAVGYFTTLTALSVLLVTRESLFFIFALIGFFHAFLLTPTVLAVLGVGVTSFVVNVLTGGFDLGTADWYALAPVLVIQAVAISAGTIASLKLAERSEQRRKAVAELEAAMEENAELHAQLLNQAREAGVQDERQRMARGRSTTRLPRGSPASSPSYRRPSGPGSIGGVAAAPGHRCRVGQGEPGRGATLGACGAPAGTGVRQTRRRTGRSG